MPVVNVRIMRMAVPHDWVLVPVGMPVLAAPAWFMRMLVVFIVAVLVLMRQRRVKVFMRMVFGQVQPHAQRHQRSGEPEPQGRGF